MKLSHDYVFPVPKTVHKKFIFWISHMTDIPNFSRIRHEYTRRAPITTRTRTPNSKCEYVVNFRTNMKTIFNIATVSGHLRISFACTEFISDGRRTISAALWLPAGLRTGYLYFSCVLVPRLKPSTFEFTAVERLRSNRIYDWWCCVWVCVCPNWIVSEM